MDPFSIVASLIGVISAIATGVASRKTRMADTREMMHEQNEMNLGNQERKTEIDSSQLTRAVQDARNSGLNPLSVVGSPNYTTSAVSSPSSTPQGGFDTSALAPILGFVSQLSGLQLERKKIDSDVEKNNAEIAKTLEETENIRQQNSNLTAQNKAIQKSLAEKGIEIPEIGATGFLQGLNDADEYFTQNTNREFRRLFDSNMINIEKLKSTPEYLDKVQQGMYSELDKKVLDTKTTAELLKGVKLDNKAKVQELRINEMRYAVIKTELAEKVFNLKLAPARASLELQQSAVNLKNSWADLKTKKLTQDHLVIQIDESKLNLKEHSRTSATLWEQEMENDLSNGNYLEYGNDMFNLIVFGILEGIGKGMGSVFK